MMPTVKKSTPVKDLRLKVKLSRVDVAAALGLKTERTILRWEKGEALPNLTPHQTAKLLDMYQCSLEELVQAFDDLRLSKQMASSDDREPATV